MCCIYFYNVFGMIGAPYRIKPDPFLSFFWRLWLLLSMQNRKTKIKLHLTLRRQQKIKKMILDESGSSCSESEHSDENGYQRYCEKLRKTNFFLPDKQCKQNTHNTHPH